MAGPVRRGEQRVSWASRSPQSSASRSPHSPLTGRASRSEPFFSPGDSRLVDNSPLPIEKNAPTPDGPVRHSAPALLGEPYRLPTMVTPQEKFSLDQRMPKAAMQNNFQLDEDAPERAARQVESSPRAGTALQSVQEVEEDIPQQVEEADAQQQRQVAEEAWGDSFAVDWISTVKLPFQRTRHLRNPWNHDREVKVSRDGTELEPTVGEWLLNEWEEYVREGQSVTGRSAGKRSRGAGAGGSEGVSN